MPAHSIETGNHLTTSRINRLLRPLRNKCANLSSFSSQVHINLPGRPSSTTISAWDTDSSPLIIEGLAGFSKKSKSDRGLILANYELKRRIRAVCDAFRNVVYGAFGTPCTERIPSLADLCSSVMGNNILVTNVDVSGTDSEADSVDEDDLIAVADEIYESIPSHYRRCTVVSHALGIILQSCSRYHALINILLDVCLSFNLVSDAQRLLSIILSQAFIPSDPGSLPPITHPAHATYLVDLHARWTNGRQNQNAQHGLSLFTTSVFYQAVLSALSHSGDHTLSAWNEVIKLGQTVGHQDIDSFARLIDALATFLSADESRILRSRSDASVAEDTRLWTLQTQLREWMIHLWDDLLPSWELPNSLSSETLPLLIDILEKCHIAGSADNTSATGHTCPRLPDIATVLATQILAYSEAFNDRLVSALKRVSPVPTTYSKLVEYLCRHRPSEERIFVEHLMSQLEWYSSILRSQNLLKLDASLWACVLSHFEKTFVNPQGSSAFISKLVDAVDAAEKRCFGQTENYSSPPVTLPSRFKRGNRGHRRKSSGHWEWEEMVECWIRKTPVHKTQKLSQDNATSRSICEDGRIRKVVRFASSLQCAKVSRRFLGSATYECFDSDMQSSDSGSEYQSDKENLEYSPSRRQPPLKKPRINFSTLLADAQTNRVDLHSNNGSSKIMIPETYIVPRTSTQWTLSPPAAQTTCRSVLSPKSLDYPKSLLSDDSLDLFAASSPIG